MSAEVINLLVEFGIEGGGWVKVYEDGKYEYFENAEDAVSDLASEGAEAIPDSANPPVGYGNNKKVTDSSVTPDTKALREEIAEQLGYAPDEGYPTFHKVEETAPVQVVHRLEALITSKVIEAETNKLEWAWGIIANAGKIWDEDTQEAKEWREVAWKLEKDFNDHAQQLKEQEG